jgi:hypothetical protein
MKTVSKIEISSISEYILVVLEILVFINIFQFTFHVIIHGQCREDQPHF